MWLYLLETTGKIVYTIISLFSLEKDFVIKPNISIGHKHKEYTYHKISKRVFFCKRHVFYFIIQLSINQN